MQRGQQPTNTLSYFSIFSFFFLLLIARSFCYVKASPPYRLRYRGNSVGTSISSTDSQGATEEFFSVGVAFFSIPPLTAVPEPPSSLLFRRLSPSPVFFFPLFCRRSILAHSSKHLLFFVFCCRQAWLINEKEDWKISNCRRSLARPVTCLGD